MFATSSAASALPPVSACTHSSWRRRGWVQGCNPMVVQGCNPMVVQGCNPMVVPLRQHHQGILQWVIYNNIQSHNTVHLSCKPTFL